MDGLRKEVRNDIDSVVEWLVADAVATWRAAAGPKDVAEDYGSGGWLDVREGRAIAKVVVEDTASASR
jgi:hypothetical protein